MSSLSELTPMQDRRSRVIRGAAATGLQLRTVPFTEDLNGSRPRLGTRPARNSVSPVRMP